MYITARPTIQGSFHSQLSASLSVVHGAIMK